MVKDEGLEGQLAEKSILITGASSGIGVESAKSLSTTDATLYLAARNLEKAKQALGDLAQSPRVHLLELDPSSLDSVRACVAKLLSQNKTLNIFIANAGVMVTPEGRTQDGFETQFGTNHLGHFLLFNLIWPALLAAATPQVNSRAVFLSSAAHRYSEVSFDKYNLRGEYDRWRAYGQSKAANMWTANEVDRRYSSQGLRAFSVHPGGIQTGLLQYMSEKNALSSDPVLGPQFKSPEQGAATSAWGIISNSLEGMGGKYLEDIQIAEAYDASEEQRAPDYLPYAYSPEKEAILWELSLRLVGLKN